MVESPHQDLVDAGGLEAVLRAACPGCDIDLLDARGAFGGFAATVGKHGCGRPATAGSSSSRRIGIRNPAARATPPERSGCLVEMNRLGVLSPDALRSRLNPS